nr:Protein F57B1.5 [Haemonchus contortus]
MPPSREPLKYLTYYPFSVLTVAKTFILVIYILSVSVWQGSTHPRQIGIVFIIVPVLNLLGCASALISLWFMVQKFYWKRVELSFNFSGVALSLLGMSVLLLSYNKESSIRNYIALNHLLVTIAWSFCLFWSRFFTSNTVSNLFINEWGRGTEDIEIEALEGHF